MNSSPSFRFQQQQQSWDTRTDMLASSIMLLSISESQASHVGYHTSVVAQCSSSSSSSILSPSNSGCGSLGSLASRQSIKTDLASLGATGNNAAVSSLSTTSSNNSFYHQQSSSVSDSSSSDDWGFYAFD